jgi:hypothetical protein
VANDNSNFKPRSVVAKENVWMLVFLIPLCSRNLTVPWRSISF